jgi:hypothetical protein
LLSIQTANQVCFLKMGPQVAPPFPAQSYSGMRKRVCGLPGCQAEHQPGFPTGREGASPPTQDPSVGAGSERPGGKHTESPPAKLRTSVHLIQRVASPQARRLVPRTASAAHEDWLGLSCSLETGVKANAQRDWPGFWSVRPEHSCNGNPS